MNTKIKNQTVGKSDTAKLVAKACGLLAEAFRDPYESVDRQTGQVSTKNALGFWQDGVLGAICYALANKLEYTRLTTMPKAHEACQVAIRSHKGDELSEVQLQRAVAWVQRLNDQEATASAALYEARTAYYVATGKSFAFRSRETANRDVVETPAMLAAKALGIGVANVAAGFGSEQARSGRLQGNYGHVVMTEPMGIQSEGQKQAAAMKPVKDAARKRAAEVKAAKLAVHKAATQRLIDEERVEAERIAGERTRIGKTAKRARRTQGASEGADDETIIRDFAELAGLLASEEA